MDQSIILDAGELLPQSVRKAMTNLKKILSEPSNRNKLKHFTSSFSEYETLLQGTIHKLQELQNLFRFDVPNGLCDMRRIAAQSETYKEFLFSDAVDVDAVDGDEEEEPRDGTDSDDDTDEEYSGDHSLAPMNWLSINRDSSIRPESRVTTKTFLLQTAISILNEAWARRHGDSFVVEEDLTSLHMLRQAVQIYCLLEFHIFTVIEKRPDNRYITRCSSCGGKILAFDTECSLIDMQDKHFCEIPKLIKKTFCRRPVEVKSQEESLLQNVFQKLRQGGYFKLNKHGVEIDKQGYAKDYLRIIGKDNSSAFVKCSSQRLQPKP
ncbi:hypothetical protein BN1211_1504 [Cyberlindnera jadinii]|uniref:Uncharacterized protein n=1 Tax=Cyberlindnera jadinii (strain ATCC 18201 / CBS 1600 / BCRC 20928 / JCM 3617 / NBRC 0987 / NRRL Y-1542) TaxID=983966 RepID=A0A0H5C0U3_CYBJN|nr:hypothetical protein BN1211_1504 [Cyberlindnera jadinii]